MKKILIFLMMVILLTSCRSLTSKGRSVNAAEKYLKSGDYYEAVIEFSNALMNDPDYKPAIEGLNSTYKSAVDQQEDKISNTKTSGTKIEYANETEKIVALYRSISRLRPETFALLNFKLEIEDLKKWTSETSKAFYDAAKDYTPRQTTFDYKAITKLYKKSYDYNPRYLDVFDKYKESKEFAMQKIVYFDLKNEYNYYNVGNLLTSKIFGLLNSDSTITEFSTFTNGNSLQLDKSTLLAKQFSNDELKNKNYFLDLNIANINFNKPRVSTNYRTKVWYEAKKVVNGVIKTEALLYLPKNQEQGVTYTEKKYTEISNYKEISIKMDIAYSLIDLKTKAVVKQGLVSDEYKDSHTSVIFIGDVYPDERPILDRELLSDFGMIEKVSDTISEKLKNELKSTLE